ncbi:putative protein [Vanrija pseudolonga]|uniref:Purtative protein n=1 Tax=Vanrija pseudolonga TaxID=143232 RepID=A0AAF0Y5M6_9TREE|nr:purtative protein [Vanrija pseudolonga]
MPRSIFFLGATGYIGSSVLSALLKAVDQDTKITILARNPAVLSGFEAADARITAVQGSLGDHSQLSALASAHDVTINTAEADDLGAVQALLRGLKVRHETTGTRPIIIHTSGTGVLADNAKGAYAGTEIFTDAEADPTANPPLKPISDLKPARIHRGVDLAVQAADTDGYAFSYIVIPATIYGISQTVFADKGLANAQSQQVSYVTRIGIDRKVPAQFGEGKNLWPNVEIHDVAELYALVYRQATAPGPGDHGENGYFFGETGEYSLLQAYEAIGAQLFALGLVESPTPKPLSDDEIDKYIGGSQYPGSNSRARAVHSRRLGWKPAHTGNEPFLASIKEDVNWTASHNRGRAPDGNFVFGPGPVRVEDGAEGGWELPGQ